MSPELEKTLADIDALKERAEALTNDVEGKSAKDIAAGIKELNEVIKPELAKLTAERDERMRQEEVKALQSQVTNLGEVIEDLKKGARGSFPVADATDEGKSDPDNPYADNGGFFRDIRLANRGYVDARERLAAGAGVSVEEGKAMSEGVAAQGGYLVQKQVEREIVQTRELDNVLRGLCSKLNVTTNEIELNQITLGTTAGWVAELAQKPEATSLTLATVSASVFTAAGLATISNQLLADANPAVDQLVTADLAKRLVALEETAFLAGTGSGQPLGILNTPGVSTTPLTSTDPGDLIDAILDAIAQVQTDVGQPTAILMHPRTWTRILKDKNSDGIYTIGSPADATNISPSLQSGRTIATGPEKSLWGVRVVLSNRIPTNLGSGTNESRVIVGDFTEALILDRQGITVDESPHVYFTSNQTVFRAEERVGFTAARQPKAFNIVGGTGLAAG